MNRPGHLVLLLGRTVAVRCVPSKVLSTLGTCQCHHMHQGTWHAVEVSNKNGQLEPFGFANQSIE